MSQFFQGSTAGSLPPTVPTQFTADDGSIGIPSGNNLNLLSQDTIDNNDNGIRTKADPNGGDDYYVELTNRIVVTATTVGATTQTQVVLTPANATGFSYSGLFTGIETTSGDSCGGLLVGLGKKSGGLVSVIGDTDAFEDAEASLNASDWDLTDSGSDLIASFTGVDGATINWKCTFTYQIVS